METNTLNISHGIDEENLNYVVDQAKDYAIFKGILMRTADLPDVTVPLPFCLLPSQFPERWFNLTCDLQLYMNLVLFKISQSREFLKNCLSSTIEADEYTANIYKIYEAVENENGANEQLSLGLVRCDYLLDCDSSGNITGIKQVESNTISASFGGLAPNIKELHEFVLKRFGRKSFEGKLPVNKSVEHLARGLFTAWEAYGNLSATILFVVEDYTRNICDQRAVEYSILKINADIEILRYSFKDLGSYATLKGKTLLVKDKEVAVVYYRTGYVPDQYEPKDWETRLLMERSKAIKCPSAGLHLAGTKRVQLELTRPGVLETFVSPDIAEKLRQVFASQYSLDLGTEGDLAISLAIGNPEKYVLKPEREGGGNNVYGSDIKNMLESIKTSDKRNAYILMERIFPPSIANCIVISNKTPQIQNIICELGIFGVILGSKKEIKVNNFAGHLLRSKGSSSNETGVAAGFGALDSPYLE